MTIDVEKDKIFSPVKLTIVIESEQELCNLWHRMNVSANSVNKASTTLVYPANDDNTFFTSLNRLVEAFKLKKFR